MVKFTVPPLHERIEQLRAELDAAIDWLWTLPELREARDYAQQARVR